MVASVIVDKKDEKIIHLIMPGARKKLAHRAPPVRGAIRLDAMESPYTWPAYLKGEWAEEMQKISLNRYPDPESTDLKAKLRHVFNVPAATEMMLGNGSDELIQIINMALKIPGRKVLAPVPSFSMYESSARAVGMEFVGVALNANKFTLDMTAMLAAIEEHQPAIVYLASPNNPTGNSFSEADIVRIAEASTGIVVVDEAFAPFSGISMMGLIEKHENLLVMRSMSKIGLAGIRLSFLVGQSRWMAEIDRMRLPYNISALSQFTGEFVLEYFDVFEEQIEQTVRDRGWVAENIRRLKGVEVFESDTNFLLLRIANGRCESVDIAMRERGVWVKSFMGSHVLLRDCLRVTVGKPSENVAFLSAITSAL